MCTFVFPETPGEKLILVDLDITLPTTVSDDQTNETKGCNLAECEKAVLMLSGASNLPMVLRKNGKQRQESSVK